ncbi:Hypothetical protein A7982_02594 [Minicystis rosea]|nr:Hypothetical protein A7982_02594 [Minicystis rosea]
MILAAALALLVSLIAAPALAGEPLPQQPAAEIDPTRFTHAAPLTLPASAGGVARVRLGPDVLAAARADLADLRVVDSASRQWPYVLRTSVEREEVALRVDLARERGRSRYTLALPVAPAAVETLTIRVDRAFFDRPYRLLGEASSDGSADPSRSMTLASGRLSRAAGGPESIDIAFAPARLVSMILVVDDGDDAPLPLTSARATLPLAELRVVAPAGAYTLLAGDAGVEPPRYEMARLRDRILAAEAPAGVLGPLDYNPRHQRAALGSGAQQVALWAVMGLAVVVLVGLTLRLSRREQEHAPKDGSPPNDG